MKKRPPLRHRTTSKAKAVCSFFLACVLAVTCYALPAMAAEPETQTPAQQDNVTSQAPAEETSSSLQEETGTTQETGKGDTSENTEPSSSEGQPEDPANPENPEEPEEPEEPQVKTYTIVFDMGPLGVKEYVVEEGLYLPEYPSDPVLPAAYFQGWFDEEGNQVWPYNIVADRDMVITARFTRTLSNILNTVDHLVYINGYENGMFKPNNDITRAEAAAIFFKLMLDPTWEAKSFSDVAESKWYWDDVGFCAGLGVVSGYPDGSFKPTKSITRAEFVKMVVSFDTLSYDAPLTFSDVKETSWAAPYIATAAKKGWINGFNDGTFRPNEPITRAQAVTVVNNMLGRKADQAVLKKTDVKNFYDMFTTNWAYGAVVEASTAHTYIQESGKETWTEYEKDTSTVASSRWVYDDGKRYYLDAKTRKFLRGSVTVNGVKYLLDSSTGAAITGFRMEGGYRRYYKDGIIQTDISGLGIVSGPYYIKVYKPANFLIIYAKDPSSGKYNTPVKAMRVSCGYPTPTGTFYTPARYRWLRMVGDTWAQWCTQIYDDYLFHSVPNWTYNNFDLEVEEYNLLGTTRSLGCIRLNCRDAKWIYDNCALGTQVYISSWETSGPLAKPAGLQIPAWHTWDPTDPTAYYRCRQLGCH